MKKLNNDLTEILKTISERVGCSVQHNGTPCNTCFHAWAGDIGLSDTMGHLFWLIVLGIRGDYSEEEIIDGIKSILKEVSQK